MSSSEVDYYDVQRMIEDEASRLRARIEDVNAAIWAVITELRDELAEVRRHAS
jgi:hypothetical protein